MKLGIVGGGGLLGSTTAFYAGLSGVLSEIKLLDVKENMVMSHAMDMDQALSTLSPTRVVKANYEELADCEIVLITASLPERTVKNRNEFLQDNLSLIKDVCENIKKYCKAPIVINATNPIDVFNYVVWKRLGLPREKMLGFCINDSVRLRWSIAKHLNIPTAGVEAICIGEHGESQVPLFSGVRIDQKPYALSEDSKIAVMGEIGRWFKNYQALESGRTSGWTSALGLGKMIGAIARENAEVIPCSAILDGEYGQKDVSIGVPVLLGRGGVREICTVPMSAHEKEKFAQSADKIRGILSQVAF